MAEKGRNILQGFGAHLKQLREDKGYTLRELDAITGIDHPELSKYETGKGNPTLLTLEKLANALEITLAELMTFNYIDQGSNDTSTQ